MLANLFHLGTPFGYQVHSQTGHGDVGSGLRDYGFFLYRVSRPNNARVAFCCLHM